MKVYQIILVILFVVVTFSCKGSRGIRGVEKMDSSAMVTKTLSTDFLLFSMKPSLEKVSFGLQIPVLNKTYNGFQLRVLEEYLDDTGHLLILKDSNNYWSAHLFNFKVGRDDSRKIIVFSYRHISLGRPKAGWQQFYDKLSRLNLKILPVQISKVDQSSTDSVWLNVEFADKHKYTCNNFSDPYKSHDNGVRETVDIVNFLKEEFGIM